MTIAVGDPAPDFELRSQERATVSPADLRGSKALIVFIPFPFTGICDGEGCAFRDNLAQLNELGAKVVVITVHAIPTNKKWADEHGFTFPVLSDFWPHGETATAYGAFNETLGVANRRTVVLDADGVTRQIIETDSLGVGREFDEYVAALET